MAQSAHDHSTPSPTVQVVQRAIPAAASSTLPADRAEAAARIDRADSPALTERADSPALTERAASPALTERAASPVLTKRAASPALTKRAASPALTKRAASPALTKRAASPVPVSWSASPARVDSTEEDESFDTGFKFYPSPIWSRTAGFSAGVGFEMENLLMPGGRFLITAKPGQHLGRYTATYFAKDAFTDPVYALANVYYETTGHQWFHGLGPASLPDTKVAVEKQMVEAEVRVGVQPFGRRLQFQPLIKYIRHESVRFEEWDEGALDRLDPESRQNLQFSTGVGDEAGVQEGFAFGAMAGVDLRDRPVRPRRGVLVQAIAQRFDFQTPSGLAYDQLGIYAYAFLPFRSGTLALRAVTQFTDQRGSVTIPFYLLPSLHGRMLPGYSWDRFFGPDLFTATLEYQLPLFNLFDVAGLDWLFSFGAGNIYDDLFDQFELDVTFKDQMERGQESYQLRPSISTGFDFFTFDPQGFDVRVLLGWGTEGIRLVKFAFVHDLREVELSKR